MSSRIKLTLVSIILALFMISITSAVIPDRVASAADVPVEVREIAGRGSGGGSFS
jgi:hypothetical protein